MEGREEAGRESWKAELSESLGGSLCPSSDTCPRLGGAQRQGAHPTQPHPSSSRPQATLLLSVPASPSWPWQTSSMETQGAEMKSSQRPP